MLVALALGAQPQTALAQASQTVIVTAPIEGNKLLARWFPFAGATGYDAEVFAGSATTASESTGIITGLSHTFTLTPGTSYKVKVTAYDANGAIANSAGTSAAATPYLPPVTGLDIAPDGSGVLRMRFKAVSGANRYQYQYRKATEKNWGSMRSNTHGSFGIQTLMIGAPRTPRRASCNG